MIRVVLGFLALCAVAWYGIPFFVKEVARPQEMFNRNVLCMTDSQIGSITYQMQEPCKEIFTTDIVSRVEQSDSAYLDYYPMTMEKYDLNKIYTALLISDPSFRSTIPDFEAWWNARPIRQKRNKQGPQ